MSLSVPLHNLNIHLVVVVLYDRPDGAYCCCNRLCMSVTPNTEADGRSSNAIRHLHCTKDSRGTGGTTTNELMAVTIFFVPKCTLLHLPGIVVRVTGSSRSDRDASSLETPHPCIGV